MEFGKWKREAPGSGTLIYVLRFYDAAFCGEDGEPLVKSCGPHSACGAQFEDGLGRLSVCEGFHDALVDGLHFGCRGGEMLVACDLEREGVFPFSKLEMPGRHGGSGAVLDTEDDTILAVASQVKV